MNTCSPLCIWSHCHTCAIYISCRLILQPLDCSFSHLTPPPPPHPPPPPPVIVSLPLGTCRCNRCSDRLAACLPACLDESFALSWPIKRGVVLSRGTGCAIRGFVVVAAFLNALKSMPAERELGTDYNVFFCVQCMWLPVDLGLPLCLPLSPSLSLSCTLPSCFNPLTCCSCSALSLTRNNNSAARQR